MVRSTELLKMEESLLMRSSDNMAQITILAKTERLQQVFLNTMAISTMQGQMARLQRVDFLRLMENTTFQIQMEH